MNSKEEVFTAKIAEGTFRVSIKPHMIINQQTRQLEHKEYSIRVGGKIPDCVFLKLSKDGTQGDFTRLDSKEGCSLDPPYTVGGEKTTTMGKLAMTIAKELNPNLKVLTLQDSASFPCELPDGKMYQVNSADYELFFYQKAYYDRRYSAILVNPILRSMYEDYKANFTNPEKKPADFDFLEPTLNKVLQPLYMSTKTWKEFIDAISESWKHEKKCKLVYLWLKTALLKVFNNVSISGQAWEIHLTSEHTVPYTKVKVGGKYTRKSKRTNHIGLPYPAPRDYFAMDWSKL
jgi:hypothetical protein